MHRLITLLVLLLSAPCLAGESLVMAYFVGNGEDGLHLAVSDDGLSFKAINSGKSLLAPKIGNKETLMRDPCIAQGPDGVFHLVWTVGWHNGRGIGYASSRDLVNWSEQKLIPVMQHEPAARNCWAPEVYYDEPQKAFIVYWSSTIPGRFPATEKQGDDAYNHRIYCTTTKDFLTFTPTRLFYDGGFNVIDATILKAEGRYNLIVKDETKAPVARKHLRIAVSDKAQGPYGEASAPFTIDWVEGPSAIRIGEHYYVYFDHYARPQYYGAVRSKDLKTWEDVSKQMTFPPGVRHGTIFRVSPELHAKLRDYAR